MTDVVQLDLRHVWHPFTAHDEWEASPPLVVTRARGAELVDAEGRVLLDGVASLWVGLHGHRHPRVQAAIRAQLERMEHSTLLGLTHEPAARLAAALAARAPGPLARVFYSDAGSTAVEVALKIAFQYQQQVGQPRRTRFAALRNAYHGDTLGAVSVGGIDLFHEVYRPLLFPAVRLPVPHHREDEAAHADRAVEILHREGPELAAIVVEPLVQGAAGMHMHGPAYLRPVLEAAREVGALVIADEVAVGMGRTGTLFAMEQVGVAPDLLCLGKALTNGTLPLAATLATEAVFDAFRGGHRRAFFHGHTYTGNPLACAAALATLEVLDEEDTLARVRRLAPVLATALEGFRELPWVRGPGAIRQAGLLAAVDLARPDGRPFPPESRTGHRVCMAARAHGVVLRPLGDTLVFVPPPCMTPAQVRRVVEAALAAVREVLGPGGA